MSQKISHFPFVKAPLLPYLVVRKVKKYRFSSRHRSRNWRVNYIQSVVLVSSIGNYFARRSYIILVGVHFPVWHKSNILQNCSSPSSITVSQQISHFPLVKAPSSLHLPPLANPLIYPTRRQCSTPTSSITTSWNTRWYVSAAPSTQCRSNHRPKSVLNNTLHPGRARQCRSLALHCNSPQFYVETQLAINVLFVSDKKSKSIVKYYHGQSSHEGRLMQKKCMDNVFFFSVDVLGTVHEAASDWCKEHQCNWCTCVHVYAG